MKPSNGNDPAHWMASLGDSILEDFSKVFEPSRLQSALDQNRASRETVVRLPIDDFLALAQPLPQGPWPDQLDSILHCLETGGLLADVPFLSLTRRLDGAVKVDGHEGRHRAYALKVRGYVDMPVRLIARDNVGIRWGQTDERPAWLLPETSSGKPVRMPQIATYPFARPLGPSATDDAACPTPETNLELALVSMRARGLDPVDMAALCGWHLLEPEWDLVKPRLVKACLEWLGEQLADGEDLEALYGRMERRVNPGFALEVLRACQDADIPIPEDMEWML